jgi:4-aminobutyrate aminotransferase-like enzyme/Ser/Thr protein kinase RdoA (MazF antagonist)
LTAQIKNSGIKFLDRNPPVFSVDEAKQIAGNLFGLSGNFLPLKSERDQNFHIQTQNNDNYVLKLSNAAENPGVIDFQTQALLHIEQQDPTLPIPRVVRTHEGALTGLIKSSTGKQHIVHSLTYLPGVVLDDVVNTPALWRNLGRMIGRLDLALRGFFHPHARHELLWDLTRCAELRPHTIHITEAIARQNIETILDHMAVKILPRLKSLRHQVIHCDAHSHNVLTDPRRPDTITGILDFGDMIYAPLVAEVAIAAELEGLPAADFVDRLGCLVAGFDSVIPLEETEIDLIYDLVLARLAVTAVIIAWRKVMTPESSYLQASEKARWQTIADLMAHGRYHVRNGLRMACRFPPYCPLSSDSDVPDQTDKLLARRHRLLGTKLSLSYNPPLHLERGRGLWLYSPQGKAYLDAYNNVPVVGHCHPHVVKAVSRQTAALNTNTRYIYRPILDYAERLVSELPGNLSVCVFVNSGSEANDIAWRIARFISGQRGALVMEESYHGITEATFDLSTYDIKRHGLPSHVQTLMSPDPYRGPYRHGEADLTERYAADTDRAIATLAQGGLKPAAFMIDTTFLSNGVPDVPEGYVQAVTAKVRAAGGLLIADEVQAGFGRSGTHMWGHVTHGVIPDIVTMGKPVGNGYPLGVVVTTPDILNAFVAETGLFSTFGGNPVACAAGMAVLDVLENEDLLANAHLTGHYLRNGIRALMPHHAWIGDVRGQGLLAGVELVRDRATQEPAISETKRLLDLMRDNGVLIGKEGPHNNVLKIRPPMVFRPKHADMLIEALDRSLAAL